MIWWLVILGGVVVILAAMYVPNWVRWTRWHSEWKKASPSKRRRMRAPGPAPFWIGYAGWGGAADAGHESALDGGFDAGFGGGAGFDGGGFDGGGGDGGGGG